MGEDRLHVVFGTGQVDVTDPQAACDAAKGASVVYQCLNDNDLIGEG